MRSSANISVVEGTVGGLQEREQRIGRPIATRPAGHRGGSGERLFLDREIGVEADVGRLDLLMSQQSAITVVSIPAFSRRIAAVCLSTWGVTSWLASTGSARPPLAACFARRWLVRRLRRPA
jgi:hypothetical protein